MVRRRSSQVLDFRLPIFDSGIKQMKRIFRRRSFASQSDNLKSKTCPESYRRIENRKWVGLFAIVLALTVCGARAEAQQKGKVPRVGFLGNSTAALEANLIGPFREGLHDLGYVEGKNIVIEWRWAEGKYERFPALIAELIAVGDPVGSGLIASLAHPGGNLTGLTSISPELDGKRLELLREVVPKISHVAVLWNPTSPLQVAGEKETQAAAHAMKIKVLSLGVQAEEQFDNAFATILRERPGALLVLADRLFLHHRVRIMDFATQNHLPGVHAYVELVEAGGLMSYGPSYSGMHRRAATYVDKILRGTKPADLPVEAPIKFELVINLRAAKQIGLTVPPNVL